LNFCKEKKTLDENEFDILEAENENRECIFKLFSHSLYPSTCFQMSTEIPFVCLNILNQQNLHG